MGQILRTEAIVLRNMDYRETSQIVTLFTREKGKLTVLAKGARLAKSHFGATLQPMAYIQAIIYHRPTRELQTISETSHVLLFNKIAEGLEKITVGVRLVEIVQALLQVEEKNEAVFELLVDTLKQLDVVEGRIETIWPYFQLKLASELGFQPFITKEEVESIEEYGYLSLQTGAVYNLDGPAAQAVKGSRKALRAFAILVRSDFETVHRMYMEGPILHELNSLVDAYIRYHVEDALPQRTHRVIAQIMDQKKSV